MDNNSTNAQGWVKTDPAPNDVEVEKPVINQRTMDTLQELQGSDDSTPPTQEPASKADTSRMRKDKHVSEKDVDPHA